MQTYQNSEVPHFNLSLKQTSPGSSASGMERRKNKTKQKNDSFICKCSSRIAVLSYDFIHATDSSAFFPWISVYCTLFSRDLWFSWKYQMQFNSKNEIVKIGQRRCACNMISTIRSITAFRVNFISYAAYIWRYSNIYKAVLFCCFTPQESYC